MDCTQPATNESLDRFRPCFSHRRLVLIDIGRDPKFHALQSSGTCSGIRAWSILQTDTFASKIPRYWMRHDFAYMQYHVVPYISPSMKSSTLDSIRSISFLFTWASASQISRDMWVPHYFAFGSSGFECIYILYDVCAYSPFWLQKTRSCSTQGSGAMPVKGQPRKAACDVSTVHRCWKDAHSVRRVFCEMWPTLWNLFNSWGVGWKAKHQVYHQGCGSQPVRPCPFTWAYVSGILTIPFHIWSRSHMSTRLLQ